MANRTEYNGDIENNYKLEWLNQETGLKFLKTK